MPTPPPDDTSLRFEQQLIVEAPPAVVFQCFFAADALRSWWQAVRSVTTPAPFGVYAVEWATTPFRDDILGALGGVFHGTVVDVRPGRDFVVADAYWMPPDGAALGPMVLRVDCHPHADGCRLRVVQEGAEDAPRWQRYYAVITRGWQVSLVALKRYAEAPPVPHDAAPGAGDQRRSRGAPPQS